MATFTVDLLTGNVYLFNVDIASGKTPSISGSTYPEVNLFSELPPAPSNSGKIYVVRASSGEYVLNRHEAGLYFSNGVLWRRLGDIPSFFLSDNFQIIDSVDNSKGFEFITSGITTNEFRQIRIQDSDGTVAYLADLESRVNVAAFADYTGTTAPNTFVDWTAFADYTGSTLSLINTKQNNLIAGDNISIVNDIISVTGNTSSKPLQLIDSVGGQSVNNIEATKIVWTNILFTGDSVTYTGGSRIYINSNSDYEISYCLNVNNGTNSGKNVGTLIRKNNNTDITQMSSTSFNLNSVNDSSTNTMPNYNVTLDDNDFIELVAFRIGGSGLVNTVGNGSWLKIQKIK